MTLEQMREFVILAEERNYLVAADMLFSTQATLSRHIMAMEEELGFLLFNRSTKKIELTQDGSRFLIYARRATRIYESFQTELGNMRRELTESVRVGYNALVTFYRFTEVLTRFMADNPDITTKITETDTDTLLDSVESGVCDVAFLQKNPFNEREGLEYIPFHSDVIMAVLPKDHPLSKKRSITLSQLRNEEFVTSIENKEPATVFLEACRRAGFEPKIAHTGLVGPALFDWIGSGGCVGLEWRIPGLTHRNDRTALVEVTPHVVSHACVVYRKGKLSDAAKKLVTYFSEQAAELGEVSNEI